jgi:uncharacterized hydrophobic protein (TIGR00271 family)
MMPQRIILRARLEKLLRIDQETKPQVYMRIFEAADLSNLNYWLELSFSAGIATLGLVLNSPAVVIGAMLISPLIGPIIGAGLALAAADLYLGIKSFLNLAASIAAALAISAGLVWLLPLHTPTAEILSRTRPNLLDLGVAFLSGMAGSLLVFRRGTSSALPGVAIAVALMPPLCASGFGIGSGAQWSIVTGAGLLFLTNLAAIVTTAFLVFLAVRMDAPDVRIEIDGLVLERAAGDVLYHAMQKSRFSRPFGDIGKLRWRALMLLAVLALLYVPLKKGLVEVHRETVARNAVNEALRGLAGADNIVTQQVNVGSGSDAIRAVLVVTGPVNAERVSAAERTILRRTGREAHIAVRQVADQAELARLRAGLETPAVTVPARQPLDAIRADVVDRLTEAIHEVWPEEFPPLRSYDLALAPDGVAVHIQYESADPLPAAAQQLLARSLETRLEIQQVKLVVENIAPPKPVRNSRRTAKSK